MKKPFSWDNYSDQPALLQDKTYKKQMRKKVLPSIVQTYLLSIFIIPLSILALPFVRRKHINPHDFFCMGIDFQRESLLTLNLINELEINRVLVRVKLWEMESISELKDFILSCKNKKITLKILQDRENIEKPELFKKNLTIIFASLGDLIDIYEIGTTINRSKWGFFSVNEYSNFFQIAYNLRNEMFPNLKLIGSGVIDFEFHFTAHTLFNFFPFKYDGISSLLYVDRRGAPENTQIGFSLSDKIALLSTMVWLSPKTPHIIHITETNWPLSNTAPYAPTSEFECVSEEEYTNYMIRYHLLAFASQQIDSVSWHQLIAPGYGFVDNRDKITIRNSFFAYKYLVHNLHNAQFLRLDIKRGYYIMQCLKNDMLMQIHWSLNPITLTNEEYFEAYSIYGNKLENKTLNIHHEPIYIFITQEIGKKINASERIQ